MYTYILNSNLWYINSCIFLFCIFILYYCIIDLIKSVRKNLFLLQTLYVTN